MTENLEIMNQYHETSRINRLFFSTSYFLGYGPALVMSHIFKIHSEAPETGLDALANRDALLKDITNNGIPMIGFISFISGFSSVTPLLATLAAITIAIDVTKGGKALIAGFEQGKILETPKKDNPPKPKAP